MAKTKQKSNPKTKLAATDLIHSILKRSKASKPPAIGNVQVEQNHVEASKPATPESAKPVAEAKPVVGAP